MDSRTGWAGDGGVGGGKSSGVGTGEFAGGGVFSGDISAACDGAADVVS